MTPEELERRRPVWDAMSDVFLDTETRWGMPHVAFVLARSGYSESELDAIWDREIVPECAWNLMQLAGEWALFVVDEEALAERADGKRPPTERVLGKEPPPFLAEQWAAIKELRAMLLALPGEAEQQARAAMWTAFVHVYLEASLEKVMFLESHVKSLRATGADQALLLDAFDAVRPVLRSLLLDDERVDEERRARDVRELTARATTP